MRYSLLRADRAPEDVWQSLLALQKAMPERADPMFNPQIAKLLADIRNDTVIALCEDAEGIAAAWPLHLRAGNWARPVGGPFSDWHGPLLRAGFELDGPALLHGCDVSGMTVFGYAPVSGELCAAGERVGGHITVLNGDGQAATEGIAMQYPKHGKKMRRLRRNLERDFTDIEFRLDDRSDESFQNILDLKRTQFADTGRHDVLSPDWAQHYIRALRAFRNDDLHLRISTLYLDGKFAAGEINMCSATVVHGWFTAYDRAYSAYSPGYLVTEEIQRDMPSRGQHIYDSGCDLDHYKKYTSNAMLPLDRGVLRTANQSLAPQRVLGAGWRGLEAIMPGKAGAILGKVRRRSDQILISEVNSPRRARGFVSALGL
ncbi:MAG: GNAT family N-acetyltransferase [Pseudomonadota bacterium]